MYFELCTLNLQTRVLSIGGDSEAAAAGVRTWRVHGADAGIWDGRGAVWRAAFPVHERAVQLERRGGQVCIKNYVAMCMYIIMLE